MTLPVPFSRAYLAFTSLVTVTHMCLTDPSSAARATKVSWLEWAKRILTSGAPAAFRLI